MSEPVVLALVGGVVSLLLVLANAWAKRISRTTENSPDGDETQDTTVRDMQRANRTLGEQLHDDTRSIIRRLVGNLDADVGARFDGIERRQREFIEEWRATMKPSAFNPLLRKLDDLDPPKP